MVGSVTGRTTRRIAALASALLLSGCIEMFVPRGEQPAVTVPAISFALDEGEDRLVVTSAAARADWHRLALDVARCTVAPPAAATVHAGSGSAQTIRPNTGASPSGASLNAPKNGTVCGPGVGKQAGTAPVPLVAGDFVSFCVMPRDGVLVRDVEVRIRDTVANAIIAIETFAAVGGCPA